MTQRTVKVGDQFKLGKWIWEVTTVNKDWISSSGGDGRRIYLKPEDASDFDWLEPEVKKLTKEQAEELKDFIALGANEIKEGTPYDIILKKIDSMTE